MEDVIVLITDGQPDTVTVRQDLIDEAKRRDFRLEYRRIKEVFCH